MIVDLLRHGETVAAARGVLRGRLDDPLSPAGWTQMRAATAGHAHSAEWEIVVTSPLSRCADFARELAAARGLPLEIDARLAELDFGAWEGASLPALMEDAAGAEAIARFWRDPWRHPPPQGETLECFEARLRDVWRDLAARHAGRHVLLVTHGGVIRLLLCAARGLPRTQLLSIEVPHAALHRMTQAQFGALADGPAP